LIVWPVLALLLLASAFCSASETALFSLDDAGRERAGPAARRLLGNAQALLISLLLVNLLVNVLVFATASGLVRHDSESGGIESPGIESLGSEHFGAIATGFLALLAVLVFGEILPKALALRAPAAVARLVAPPVSLLVAALAPVRRIVRFLLEIATRILGEATREEPRITAETLAEVLGQSAEVGLLAASEADLLAEVVELEGIRVREIMTPRVDMLSLDLQAEEDDNIQIMARALARRLTWLPVVRGHADQVSGCVRMRDILSQPERPLIELVRPALFVPEVAGVLDLLKLLRDKQATEAVVVDEWGGTAGTVTVEDVFEEIVGDLRVEGEVGERAVLPLGDGRFRVSGGLSIRDWNERFNLEVVPEGFETVGGFVTALLGRIPRAGDRVRHGDLVWQVREVRGRRVRSVDMYLDPGREESA
jgi:CBS domain containing-hemolysin-like protein